MYAQHLPLQDGDGQLDVVSSGPGSGIGLWKFNAALPEKFGRSTIASLTYPFNVALGDVDGDNDTGRRVQFCHCKQATVCLCMLFTTSFVGLFPLNCRLTDVVSVDGGPNTGTTNAVWVFVNNGARPPVWTAHQVASFMDPRFCILSDCKLCGSMCVSVNVCLNLCVCVYVHVHV
jgi:hypothetical protein